MAPAMQVASDASSSTEIVSTRDLEDWVEVQREEERVNAGTAPRESYLRLAGQTLGKWIWGGSRTSDIQHGMSPSHHGTVGTTTTSSSSTAQAHQALHQQRFAVRFSERNNIGSHLDPQYSPISLSLRERERGTMERRSQSVDSLEINQLSSDKGRSFASGSGTAQEDEERGNTDGMGESLHLRGILRRGRNLVNRMERWSITSEERTFIYLLDNQVPNSQATKEEAQRRRRSRRLSVSNRRTPNEEGWSLVDHPPQMAKNDIPSEALTDEEYAALVFRFICFPSVFPSLC